MTLQRPPAARVGAIILVAGGSLRLGRPKQLLEFEGQSLLRRVTLAALESRLDPVVVVLGAGEAAARAQIEDLPVLVVFNPDWQDGLSHSVRAGLDALEECCGEGHCEVGAVVLAPCDQPLLDSAVFDALLQGQRRRGCPIVVSGYAFIWGTPMLFGRALWGELRALSGDRGAQKVALGHAASVECVPFAGGAFDVDTPADSRRLAALELISLQKQAPETMEAEPSL